VPVFWIGLFPDEPMRKTENAALHFQKLVAGASQPDALVAAPPRLVQRRVEATR